MLSKLGLLEEPVFPITKFEMRNPFESTVRPLPVQAEVAEAAKAEGQTMAAKDLDVGFAISARQAHGQTMAAEGQTMATKDSDVSFSLSARHAQAPSSEHSSMGSTVTLPRSPPQPLAIIRLHQARGALSTCRPSALAVAGGLRAP